MPAPSTIVTFTDADGDEFPVQVVGAPSEVNRSRLVGQARKQLDRLADAGELEPTAPVKATRVEPV